MLTTHKQQHHLLLRLFLSLLVLLIVFLAGYYLGLFKSKSFNTDVVDSFTKNWQIYTDKEAGFSLKYPHDLMVNNRDVNTYDNKLSLRISSQPIESMNSTLGYEKSNALSHQKNLKKNIIGEAKFDFAFEPSRKIKTLSQGVNAEEFLIFGRFEVCDVVFERSLIFYKDGYFIMITLFGPNIDIMANNPGYFGIYENNCGEAIVWDFENEAHNKFYEALTNGQTDQVSHDWYLLFDQIISTINFTD